MVRNEIQIIYEPSPGALCMDGRIGGCVYARMYAWRDRDDRRKWCSFSNVQLLACLHLLLKQVVGLLYDTYDQNKLRRKYVFDHVHSIHSCRITGLLPCSDGDGDTPKAVHLKRNDQARDRSKSPNAASFGRSATNDPSHRTKVS